MQRRRCHVRWRWPAAKRYIGSGGARCRICSRRRGRRSTTRTRPIRTFGSGRRCAPPSHLRRRQRRERLAIRRQLRRGERDLGWSRPASGGSRKRWWSARASACARPAGLSPAPGRVRSPRRAGPPVRPQGAAHRSPSASCCRSLALGEPARWILGSSPRMTIKDQAGG